MSLNNRFDIILIIGINFFLFELKQFIHILF